MKKTTIVLFILGICTFSLNRASAQQTFNSGDNVFNLGFGLGGDLYAGGGYATVIPPIEASWEHGMNVPKLGLGIFIGVASESYQVPYNDYYDGHYYGYYTWRYTDKLIGIRGAYHFYTQHKFDVYAGAILGYNSVSYSYTGPGEGYNNYATLGSGIAFDIFIGGRYYFSHHWGVYAELGYGIDLLSIGVTAKL